MKQLTFIFSLLMLATTFSCSSPTKKEGEDDTSAKSIKNMSIDNLNKEIKKREEALNSDTTNMDKRKAAILMEAYATYAERFPNYEEAADRLFKAGELAMGLNHSVEAIKYFDEVYNKFDQYEKRPYALFMKAFVLENQVHQYDQAEEIYKEFIQLYPNHEMADDAQYSIDNMGKSPEELIKQFERKDSLEKAKKAA